MKEKRVIFPVLVRFSNNNRSFLVAFANDRDCLTIRSLCSGGFVHGCKWMRTHVRATVTSATLPIVIYA